MTHLRLWRFEVAPDAEARFIEAYGPGGDWAHLFATAPGFIRTRMSVTPDGAHEHETDWFKYIYVKHRRIPLAHGGVPDDIAGPAFFFCSDDSRYVTGQILPVDGGMMSTL